LIESIREQPKMIDKFVMCHLCFTTPILSTPTALASYVIIRARQKIVLGLFPYQAARIRRQLITKVVSRRMYLTPSVTKMNDAELKPMTDMRAQWMCKDVYPFTVVDDEPFR
jgi:hypothetical protein